MIVAKKCHACKKRIEVDTTKDETTCQYCGTEYKIAHRLNPENNHLHHGGISLYIPPEPRSQIKNRVVEYVKKFPGCTVADISKEIDYSTSQVRRTVVKLSDCVDIRIMHMGKRSKWFVYMKESKS